MGRDWFVGRTRELAEIEGRLPTAPGDAGSLILVDADAGMGKTALADELTRRATQVGLATCWGSCVETEGAPAFHPWLQVLAGLGAPGHGLLDRDVGSRFQLFDDVVDVLRTAAGSGGLFIVLDDLHWADLPSMRLLQAVVSGIAADRMLVLGLYREQEADRQPEVRDAIAALRRERSTSRIRLDGLAPVEVEQLAQQTTHRQLEPAAVQALVERAEGNPLFVIEMVRLGEAAGRPDSAPPRGVRQVIGRRLGQVDQQARDLLRQAAVLGREFTVDQLAGIAEISTADTTAGLDEAIEAELVSMVEGHSLRFTHVLIQDACYADLSASERAKLHLRAAGVCGDSADLVDARAHHLRRAGSLAQPGAALEATVLAARRARRQLGYEHAAAQFRHALELVTADAQPPMAKLLLELAECEFRAGAVADAWATCRRAADLGRASGDADIVGRAAMVIAGAVDFGDEIHGLCGEALAMLDGRDPVLEARLLGQLACTANAWAGAEPGLSERALLAAEATGDAEARFLALQARHTDLTDFRSAPERLALGDQAVRLGREVNRDDFTAWGHVARIEAFWQLSRRLQLDAELRAYETIVARMREPLARWRFTLIRASLAVFEGRHADAAALADEALQIGRRGGSQDAELMDASFRTSWAPLTGQNLDELEAFVRRFVEAGPFAARNWHAKILVEMGRMEEAAALFDSVLPHVAAMPRFAPEWIIIMTGSASLCVSLNRRDAAPVFYEVLLPFADRQAIARPWASSDGPVALFLGQLALLLEDWDSAQAHLDLAQRLASEMGSPLFEAKAQLETGRLLLARRRPGDAPKAEAELTAAAETARRLAIPTLESEVVSVLTLARSGRATTLSAREEEVAALVADGLSNRQIASALHLSERTVESHVKSIFNKLGFDSRTRIAAWYAAR